MGLFSNQYHLDDEGNVYRINADGSFTRLGDVRSLERQTTENEVVAELIDEKERPTFSTPDRKTSSKNKNSIAEILCYLILFVLIIIDFQESSKYQEAPFIDALFTDHPYLWAAIFSIIFSIMLSKKNRRRNWLINILIVIGNFSLLVDQEYMLFSWCTIFIIPILMMAWFASMQHYINSK